MSFRPRYPCVIIRQSSGGFDGFGRPKTSSKRIKTRCDVVHIREEAEHTTVRADSSASRGRAEEFVNDARLMVNPREDVRLGDLVEVKSFGEPGARNTFEIVRIMRRVDVGGRVHHIEIDCDRYAPSEAV